MFDLTKNIKLDEHHQKIYEFARVALYTLFIVGALLVAYKILFPSQFLTLSLVNLNSTKNTLVNPRQGNGAIPVKGKMPANNIFTFDANPLGDFSSVDLNFTIDKGFDANEVLITARKSYQSFFYPTGQPLGFKSGSLLTTPDGNYFIVSNGALRRFENPNIILEFGFPKNSFISISNEELKFNQTGPDISSSNTYPDDTLFLIEENFYQLKNNQLLPFVSNRAFLSQYQSIQAIPKNKDFFNTYPASEIAIGFADGTIASAGGSAFILSKGKSYPIADFNTFEAMGFFWDNVVALESDELGAYEQQKQFTLRQPHPDGTFFFDKESGKYFMINERKKLPALSSAVLKTYLPKGAIEANEADLEKEVSCVLKKKLFSTNKYSCQMSLERIADSLGNNYEIQAKFSKDTKINEISSNFSTPLSITNLKYSLWKIKENMRSNYSR